VVIINSLKVKLGKSVMLNNQRIKWLVGLSLALWISHAAIAASPDSAVFDEIMIKYQTATSGWEKTIKQYAYQLFWSLTLISMVWTFGILALKKADISDFFVELIRFLGFTGFYLWLLNSGPHMAMDFINSLKAIAGEATHTQGLEPVDIINSGLTFFEKIVDATDFSIGSIAQAIIATGLALVILALFGLIAINMMLLTIAGWILAYAGIFFLGFGGSRWTSDMAIAYYKNVLMVGTQLMVMILVIGIGQSFLDDLVKSLSAEVVIKELGVLLLATMTLYHLANKVPMMIASVVMGHSHTGHIGQAGTSSLLTGAVTAAAVGSQLAQSAVAAAQSLAGGSMAVQAALKQSNTGESSVADLSSLSRMSDFNASNAESPTLASAMGESIGTIGGSHQAPGKTASPVADSGNSASMPESRPFSGESPAKAFARGIGELAKDKIAQTKQHILTHTLGGQLATAIENPGSLSEQRSPSTTHSGKPDFNAEISAFRDKQSHWG
jgi:type IV secretion system protein TrbL